MVSIGLWPIVIGATVICYLVGSVPFGLILTRAFGLGDIRGIGSGNIGATNVLRTGSKRLAAATLVLDAGKGAAGVLIGGLFARTFPEMPLLGAIAAVVGHMFPVWLKFKGGKGVATGWGALTALAWPSGLVAIAVWVTVVAGFRISSLGALVTTLVAPLHAWYFAGPRTALTVAVVAALIWFRHYQNVGRLLRGEEPRIGQKKT